MCIYIYVYIYITGYMARGQWCPRARDIPGHARPKGAPFFGFTTMNQFLDS